jgi:hypothetical protein
MADVQAPTVNINTQQAIEIDDSRNRVLMELEVLRLLEMEMNTLDPQRGYEVR